MNPYPIFDCERFGISLREWRRESGFSNTASFSDVIWKQTGVKIDKDTLVRIERGERLPDIKKFFAIVFTLGEMDGGIGWKQLAIDFLEDAINGLAAFKNMENELEDVELSLNGLDDVLRLFESGEAGNNAKPFSVLSKNALMHIESLCLELEQITCTDRDTAIKTDIESRLLTAKTRAEKLLNTFDSF